MPKIYFNTELTEEDIKLIKGCLLTSKETFKCIPIKNNLIKTRIIQIDKLLEKISEGS